MVLGGLDRYGPIEDVLRFSLLPRKANQRWTGHQRACLDGFSAAQRDAVVEFLEWSGSDQQHPSFDLLATIEYRRGSATPQPSPAAQKLCELDTTTHPPSRARFLELHSDELVDNDLEALASFPRLEYLSLRSAHLTDAALLLISDGLPNLRSLEFHCRLSRDALTAFRSRRPDVRLRDLDR